MSIFNLLGLKKGASKGEVRARYLRKVLQIHPDRSKGDGDGYMRLVNAYERYARGEEPDSIPYLICSRAHVDSVACRCGGTYKASYEMHGRVECEFCSCFIEIEDFPELPDASHRLADGT
ncbi:hypothetical protein [Encephalitozoon cuniculi GB-M1]|uniref:J domain-containing protein n=2 Tax=Encephalitozoon cuniculi TaxID=6035 RepID=Q8SVZ8_ENCCU|nr:uncharacterized protein ECU03_1500 [Encephalitozoon cuniculi GB-M1]AGE96428.1 hypothetical protein ECU03_1500 [Encephalitozoon cuniculi]KMV66513.1 hypothetical protein M970_031450 [Encephalitozoon cuniculi EcunIII-L]UYI28141.1 hypothetical protein J0A71_09g20390 [Encephalitozoon cuniculi]CAD26293.1 hypothetical protein [Encephalitozoon cuniculi GB-M1]